MINHGRTLLLNKNGHTRPGATFFLEEYVPTGYREVSLPATLDVVRKILFGSNADDSFINYRLWQFMHVLHSTDFEDYLTDLDSRITYLTKRSIVDNIYGSSGSPVNAAAAGTTIEGVGSIAAWSSRPVLRHSWTVDYSTPSSVLVTNDQTLQSSEEQVTFDTGISSLIPMVGQRDFYSRIAPSLPVGGQWAISYMAEPPADLSDLLDPLETIGGESSRALFGTGEEPYKTFSELWEKHDYFHYRLSGLLLAYIYRVEELRTGGE
jgi:hypothetical protein